MRAAVYARFSSDLQRDRSIEDQILQAETIARRFNLRVVEVFSDRAVSGASMIDRPGLLDLMTAAKAKRFDAVIVESLSRLSRDEADTASIFKRLKFNGVTIYDPNGEVTDIAASVGGIVNSQFLKNLATSIKRSMNARAREGLIMGKINYGHRGVLETLPNGLTRYKPGVREIDPETAPVVLRIFEEYANGKSARSIAQALTKEGIKSPSGSAVWCPGKIVGGNDGGFIGNPIYIGKLRRNKTTHLKNPDTGKRVQRKGRKDEQFDIDVPHLRIIPDDLWNAAQQARAANAPRRIGAPKGRTREQHLLLGMLVCECCGGNMIIGNNDKDGSTRVVCSYGLRRMGCEHTKSYSIAKLEAQVIAGIKRLLTDPADVMKYTRAYHTRWAERQREARGERDKVQRDITRVSVQIDRTVTAIAETDEAVKPLVEKLKKLEAERVGLVERLRLVDSESNIVDLHPKAIETFCGSMGDMVEALGSGDLGDRWRTAFRNVFERVVVHKTGARLPYEVTPYARLSAITGFSIPEGRSAEEMLAEQGVGGRIPYQSFMRWSPSSALVCLGRWAA